MKHADDANMLLSIKKGHSNYGITPSNTLDSKGALEQKRPSKSFKSSM